MTGRNSGAAGAGTAAPADCTAGAWVDRTAEARNRVAGAADSGEAVADRTWAARTAGDRRAVANNRAEGEAGMEAVRTGADRRAAANSRAEGDRTAAAEEEAGDHTAADAAYRSTGTKTFSHSITRRGKSDRDLNGVPVPSADKLAVELPCTRTSQTYSDIGSQS